MTGRLGGTRCCGRESGLRTMGSRGVQADRQYRPLRPGRQLRGHTHAERVQSAAAENSSLGRRVLILDNR